VADLAITQAPLWKVFCEPVQALAQDKGFIGQVLRRQPDWLLKEADRWEDPWNFLLGLRGLAKSEQDVFRAARSVREGAQRATDLLAEWGSGRTSLRENLKNAVANGYQPAIDKAVTKFIRAVWKTQSQDFQERLATAGLCSKHRVYVERLIKEESDNLKRRHGKHWSSKTSSQITTRVVLYHRLIVLLVRWWVRCGPNGLPGFMVFSNKALTDLLSILLDDQNLKADRVEQTRYRLHLKPASEKKPLIVRVIPNHDKGEIFFQGRRWIIRGPETGETRSGDTTCRVQDCQITLCGMHLFPRKSGRHLQ